MNLRRYLLRRPAGRVLHRAIIGLLLLTLLDLNQHTVLGVPTPWVIGLLRPAASPPVTPIPSVPGPTAGNRLTASPPLAAWVSQSMGDTWTRGFPYLQGETLRLDRVPAAAPRLVAQAPGNLSRTPSETICLPLIARAKPGKIQLVWSTVPGTFTYEIYRGLDADPVTFHLIGTVPGNATTYLDSPLANEQTFLYFVRAVGPGIACDSEVASAHPTNARRALNFPPVIFSIPPAAGVASELITYLVRASDPNPGDTLHYELIRGPADMTLDPISGRLEWLAFPGQFDVLVRAFDSLGASDFQAFSLLIPQPSIPVPDVIGLTEQAATSALLAAGLVVGTVTSVPHPTVPVGTVLSQDPTAGTSVPPGSAVDLVLSSGPAPVLVPNVVGLAQQAAASALLAAGLVVGTVTSAPHPTVPVGTVLSQDPTAGTSVPPGSAVDLILSSGPAQVVVPNVVGLAQQAAASALLTAGLVVGTVTSAPHPTVPVGTVLSQDPTAGTSVLPGSAVDLVLSSGPAPVEVPDVVGLTLDEAETALENVDLLAGEITLRHDPIIPAGQVLEQDPTAGTSVPPGSAVDLVLSSGPAPVLVPNVVGLAQQAAASALLTAGLVAGAVTSAPHPTVPVGTVLSQDPTAGTSVPPGSAVDLVLSSGPAPVLVPNVVGLAQQAAASALLAAGLVVGTVTSAPHPTVPVGTVLSQDPTAGTSVPPGSAVDLVLSSGPAPVVVPNVVGLAQQAAASALLAAGLVVGTVTSVPHPTVPVGTVLSQDPTAGTSVPPGSAVDLILSSGPAQVIDITLPTITVTATPGIVNPGETVALQVQASDDIGVAGVTLRVGLVDVPLNDSGLGTFIPAAPGFYQAVAQATDAAGNVGTGTTEFTARSAANNGPPTVALTSPAVDAILTNTTVVIGTASDADLAFYELQTAPAGSADFLTFATGTTSVTGGPLGDLNPAAFLPGIYQVRVCAEDTWGTRVCSTPRQMEFANPATAPGSIRFAFFDGFVQMAGFPIAIRRVYDSRDKGSGDFGVGWNLDTDDIKLQANREMGRDWRIERSGSFLPNFRLLPSAEHRVTVHLPDGSTHRFRMRPDPEQQQIVPISFLNGATFEPYPGTTSTLLPNFRPELVQPVLNSSGPVELFTIELELYNPTAYTLRLKDGRELVFHQIGTSLNYRLALVREPNGNSITFNPNGVSHSAGAAITFTRDPAGRITALTDPDGRTRTYVYDAAGDLVSSTDFTGQTTEYRYDNAHNLLQVIDPRGTIPGTLIYDEQNRVVGVIDANGNRIDVQRDEAANQEIITDRLGQTTVHTYDAQGNILSTLDALGHTTSFTYDPQGNLLTRTDPLGHTESFTYDPEGRLLTYTDPLGHVTTQTYNAAGNLVSQTDPLGRTFTYEYSPQGNLAAIVTPRGGRVEQSYDAAGNLATYRSPTGETASFSRNPSGRLNGYTFPGGRSGSLVTRSDGQLESEEFTIDGRTVRYQYDYDANGSLTDVTLPNGATASLQYDPSGLPAQSTDSLGRTTHVEFDPNGNLTSHLDYDGTRLELERDAENRVTAITRGGQRIDRVLDPLGRPTVVRMPGGRETSTLRDPAGRIISQTQTGEGALQHEYDAAGRVTRTTAADGAVTRYEYDAAGQLVRLLDPLDQPTRFEYDPDGNLVRTLFVDGTEVQMEYDLARRLTAATDELGARMAYAYDTAGDLASATDPAGGVTTYAYDGMGNLTQADTPAGRTWAFSYDLLGNQLSRTFPWGGSERYRLDAGGGITNIVDGAGLTTAFAYDAANRVVRRQLEGGRTESFDYSPSGQLRSASTPSESVDYAYDAADRVTRVDFGPDGDVRYTYDAAGRLASLQTPGGTTTYTYDAVGRLTDVADSQAGNASYQYDLAGRLAQATLPDGSTTVYTRDDRGRITRILTTAPGGAVLRDETITRDAAGNPTAIQEGFRQTAYTFDAAGRVASETRTGPDPANATYTYDADWNLLQNGARSQAYDAGGRLASDGRFTQYTYDDAGRPLTRSNATISEQFTYDSLGRLIQVDRTGALPARVELDYNHRGLLRRIVADGTARHLLWDVTATVPVLLEERDDAGNLLARYAYGLGPMAVTGPAVRILHHDPLGSVRLVTAPDASLVERTAFSAYGERTLGTGNATRLQFTGEYFLPELGLYFLRTRFYDPVAGRFFTPDHLEPVPNQPQTYNPYLYVGANPVRFRDPLGTFSVASVSIGIAIASVLVSIALPHFPAPVLMVARALGLTQADAQVGISLALSIGQGIWAGGLQVDILWGPTKKVAVLWIFAGGEIGSVRSDPRFGGVNIIFWAGPIYGEAAADPGDPRPGIYIMFSGTLASVLGDFAFKGRDGNSTRVRPQWSRGSGALQFEVIGINRDATFGSSFRQAFTFYGAGWNSITGELDKIKFAARGQFKFPGSGSRLTGRTVWNAGIALSVYLPVLWVIWDGNQVQLKTYFDLF